MEGVSVGRGVSVLVGVTVGVRVAVSVGVFDGVSVGRACRFSRHTQRLRKSQPVAGLLPLLATFTPSDPISGSLLLKKVPICCPFANTMNVSRTPTTTR